MNTLDFLDSLKGKGVALWLEGQDRLGFRADKGVLTPELIAEIRSRKSEILAFFRENALPAAMPQTNQAGSSASKEGVILPAPMLEHPPLSFAQERLWFIARWAPNSPAYHIARGLGLHGPLDAAAVEDAILNVQDRQQSLRTAFHDHDGRPFARVIDNPRWRLNFYDFRGLAEGARPRAVKDLETGLVRRPFDLRRAPLMRFVVVRLGPEHHLLWLNLHHIIADDWSIGIFVHEWSELYNARTSRRPLQLRPPPVCYADFAYRQRRQADHLAGHLDYWLRQLRDLPTLDLATDRPRPRRPSFQGGLVPLQLPENLTEALAGVALESHASLYMLLLAAFQTLLFRYSGQDDLPIGASLGNRDRPEIEGLIGLFVNLLVMRGDLSGDPGFRELLDSTRATALAAYEHGAAPFERVVKICRVEREPSRHPLFQVQLIFTSAPQRAPDPTGVRLEPLHTEANRISRLDLTLALQRGPNGLCGGFEYRADLFEAPTIQRLADRFQVLLTAIAVNPDQRLSRLAWLTRDDWEFLASLNHEPDPPQVRTDLIRWFEGRVTFAPDRAALTFQDRWISYAALNAEANRISEVLHTSGVGPDVPVLLCADRNPELVAGILGILKAGGAYVPLDPDNPGARLQGIIANVGAPVLLVSRKWARRFRSVEPAGMQAILLEPPGTAPSRSNPRNRILPQNLAYIIHTSGSTGRPKGVAATHHNAVRLFRATRDFFEFDGSDVWTLFHSPAFDFSVWELWGALLSGGRSVIVPARVSRVPDQFQQLCLRQGVRVLSQTPSAFAALLTAGRDGEKQKFRPRWIILGGEALSFAGLRPWFERESGGGTRLANMFGITETTVHVTWRAVRAADALNIRDSRIGGPLPDLTLYLLDSRLRPVAPGVAGEIFVGGAGLTRGYFKRPDLTAWRFIANPFSRFPGARLYRSGDRARCLPDQRDWVYLGRLDAQIKLRGFRIECGEIETAVRTHPRIREAAVLMGESVRPDGKSHTRLVGFFTAQEPAPTAREVRLHLESRLPGYMVPAAPQRLEQFPLTLRGKLERRALNALEPGEPAPESGYVAPRSPREDALVSIWERVLGVKRVGIHDNFFHLGGDSLISIQIKALACERGLDFELRALFEHPTVAALAPLLRDTGGAPARTQSTGPFDLVSARDRQGLPPEVTAAYPLAQLQLGMMFHASFEEGSSHYHDIFYYQLTLAFDEKAMRRTLDILAARHEVLRTAFALNDFEQPLQLVYSTTEIPFTLADWRGKAEPETAYRAWLDREKRRPFDWKRPPLLQVIVHLWSDRSFRLAFRFHHAILDGWSEALLFSEWLRVYQAPRHLQALELPPLTATFRDFVALEQQSMHAADSREFWDGLLEDAEVARLPRIAGKSGVHAASTPHHLPIAIDQALSDALHGLARALGLPLKAVLLAAHFKALSRVAGSVDVTSGVLANGRVETEGGERMLGLFLNTLPYRLRLRAESWADLVRRVHALEIRILPHRRYPLAELVRRRGGRPLFEADFNFTHFHVLEKLREIGAEALVTERGGVSETHFVWMVNFSQRLGSGRIQGSLTFDASQIDGNQARQLVDLYQRVLHAMTESPAAGHHLAVWSETQNAVPTACRTDPQPHLARGFVAGFEERAARIPDTAAVVDGPRILTYAALNRTAGRLAAQLRARGLAAEDRVGLLLERGMEMILGMLATLKAGAAYVPLDPRYPDERLTWMLADADPRLLLTLPSTAERLQTGLPRITPGPIAASEEREASPRRANHPRQAAYLIYTTGSTGRPKGAVIEHGALSHFCRAVAEEYALAPGDRVLQFCAMSFDMSVREIFPTLLAGATLVIARHEHGLTDAALERLIALQFLSVLVLPTAFWHQWAFTNRKIAPCLRILDVGGEQAQASKLTRWLRHAPPSSRWLNTYGPTETTVVATWFGIRVGQDPPRERIPIGKPLPRTAIHVLDAFLNPAPLATPGEIFIGGAGLGRGYHRRPDLSARCWIPHPLAHETNPGARLYRSGDLGRWTPDGQNLEYLGRSDGQRKVRGYRIETGEVETALLQHPAIEEVAVDVRPEKAGTHLLVAWYRAATAISGQDLTAFLQSRLPQPLLPDRWVALEHLPRTPSGKLDRRALPEPDAAVATTWLAPRNLMETRLTRLWERVLDTRPIGVRDKFSERGGHSLKAVVLLSLIETHLGRRLPVGAIYRHPTIESLAAWLEGKRTPGDSPLVLLRPGKGKPTWYLVHPAGGQIHWYVALAYALAEQYPVYGLEGQDSSQPGQAIGSIACQYGEASRRQNPEGPYLLAGWSSGGPIAFELACQMEASGGKVSTLVLIDSLGPGHYQGTDNNRQTLPAFALDLLGGPAKLDLAGLTIDVESAQEPQMAIILEALREAGKVPPGMSLAYCRHLFRTYKGHMTAVRAYRPERRYAGRVTLIRSTDTSGGIGRDSKGTDPSLGWQPYCEQPITVYDLPRGHHELLADEWVAELAALMERGLT